MEATFSFGIDWDCIYLSSEEEIELSSDEELVKWLERKDDEIVLSSDEEITKWLEHDNVSEGEIAISSDEEMELWMKSHDNSDTKSRKVEKPVAKPVPKLDVRFTHVSDDAEIDKRIKGNVPQKTQSQNKWAVNAWAAWAAWRNKMIESDRNSQYSKVPSDIRECADKKEMGHWLSRFVIEIRRKDSKEYPYNSLYNMCCALQRHVNGEQRNCDIEFFNRKDAAFFRFYEALDSKMRELADKGIGIETRQADEITVEDEDKLWTTGVINVETAQGLSNGVFFYNEKLFGLRAMNEHKRMKVEMFEYLDDKPTGRRGIRFKGRLAKNWQGGLKHRKTLPKDVPHWHDPNNPRDIFVLYNTYLSLLPSKGEFYRRPINNLRKKGLPPKFSTQNIGINKLATYMARMFEEAGIDTTGRFISNHSGKVTTCSRLYNEGFDDQSVCSRSGHRSDAVRRYKRMGRAMEFRISDALQPPLPKKKTPTSSSTITKARVQSSPETTSSTRQESSETQNKEKCPSLDLASIVEQLKSAGGGSITIGSGTDALNITVNK